MYIHVCLYKLYVSPDLFSNSIPPYIDRAVPM